MPQERGNKAKNGMTCVYHSWTYDLRGQLKGIAFRNGIKGKGGMPDDFDPAKHRMQRINVEIYCGLVFGSFADDMPSMEEYLGEKLSWMVKRNFGRRLSPWACIARSSTITGNSMLKTSATLIMRHCCTPSM